MALGVECIGLDLKPLDRRVDEARGAARCAFFAQHMPRLKRVPHLELYAAVLDDAVARETELACCVEPHRIEIVTEAPQVIEHFEEILPDEMLEHEAVVQ